VNETPDDLTTETFQEGVLPLQVFVLEAAPLGTGPEPVRLGRPPRPVVEPEPPRP
jgi:hypothetical protein